LDSKPLNLGPIKSRLVNAGYPRPEPGTPTRRVRELSREAQEARAELRDHIIEDVWALIDEVELLRAKTQP
jgi:hypothetical protein